MRFFKFWIAFIFVLSCSSNEITDTIDLDDDIDVPNGSPVNPSDREDFYNGADLSYLNEMLDCGALFYDANNKPKDPY